MESPAINNPASHPINVFIVGNNPMELSTVYRSLKNFKRTEYIAEIAFDLKSTLKRILQFKPSCILIDDNLGSKDVNSLIHSLTKNEDTKDIPVTILKNSNYSEVMTEGMQDFILKENFSADSLYRSFLNSHRLRRTQLYLYKYYKKGKGKISKVIGQIKETI